MQASWKRAASITLAASCAVALVGCKQPSEQADDAIQAQLIAARDQANKPDQDPATVVSYFHMAATIPDASDMSKVHAEIALANASTNAADALIRKIESRQVEVVKLTSLIEQQAARIAANNTQIASLKALEPKAAQEEMDKLTAAAQGGADGAAWVPADAAAIPSAAGVKQQIATLTDQIDKLTTQKNNLQTQRAQLLLQAEQLLNQSDSAKGQKSLDLFVQSAKLTKQAGDLAVQSDQISAQIAAAQQDLALANAAQTQIAASIDALNKQSAQIKQGWSDMQKIIQERSDSSTALLSGSGEAAAAPADASAAAPTTEPTADMSITAAAAALDGFKTQNGKMRDQAEKYLNDALDALKSASAASSKLAREYALDANDIRFKDFPQRDAWQGMIDVHNPSDVKLAMALVQMSLARLHSDHATATASRALAAKLLDAALTPAALTAPDSLKAGSLDQELAEARKSADDAYSAADGLLVEVSQGPGGGLLAKSAKDAAQAVQVVELYARAQFAAAMGDQKAAQSLLSDSKRARDEAVASNVQLPPLPTELAAAVPTGVTTSAPSAPAPTPAPAPASAPATPAGPGSVLDSNAPPATPAAPGAPAAGAPAKQPQ